ncbi:SEC-C metal-binding domain-containing protein [Bradyrhizobium roseum]|uniref:SEC-C metal-binding domain-containing protein n=1 Tax=Bradyrhizobium roseum TaxID=3056648 RepID=UPI00260305B1|nr:SEC-C metal-binding domain-containing protein [Bradyrhizobium roseus]WKA31618.1 SEC-C metal-binding domain-containing protein [Bradyrhizobium roseus]
MTLGLGILTREFTCLVSDRRTSANGFQANDEFDKMCLLMTREARVAISFSGLATAGRYNSKIRLLDHIRSCALPDFLLTPPHLFSRLTERLNADFLKDPQIRGISRRLRRFSLLMIGFRRRYEVDRPTFGFISNFQNLETGEDAAEAWDEFRPFFADFPEDLASWGFAIGDTTALDGDQFIELREQAPRLTALAVRARLVRLVQKASKRSRIIGGQVSSITFPNSWATPATCDYHVLAPQRSIYYPAEIVATPPNVRGNNAMTYSTAVDNGPFLAVPLVGRNKLCPCKSGLRYKECHHRANSAFFTWDIDYQDPSYGMAGKLVFNVPELLQSNSKRHQAMTVRLDKRARAKLRSKAAGNEPTKDD